MSSRNSRASPRTVAEPVEQLSPRSRRSVSPRQETLRSPSPTSLRRRGASPKRASKKEEEGCVKQSTKKYADRKSPAYPANQCQGETMEGNDGAMYDSVSNSRGVYTWRKAKSASTAPTAAEDEEEKEEKEDEERVSAKVYAAVKADSFQADSKFSHSELLHALGGMLSEPQIVALIQAFQVEEARKAEHVKQTKGLLFRYGKGVTPALLRAHPYPWKNPGFNAWFNPKTSRWLTIDEPAVFMDAVNMYIEKDNE